MFPKWAHSHISNILTYTRETDKLLLGVTFYQLILWEYPIIFQTKGIKKQTN